jgi:rhamnulokinase
VREAVAEHYLAFDLGAGSGRAILGSLDDDKLRITELHRFPNRMKEIRGGLHWDVSALHGEILQGMRICRAALSDTPRSVGIDTWGVDFGLFDDRGELIEEPFTYRDRRTQGIMAEFFKKLPREKLYDLTGVQFIPFNTVFQLYSMVRKESPHLMASEDLLFIPDIFNYLLTGAMRSEFTFATTSQLYNPRAGSWEDEIFECLTVPKGLMQEIVQPGTIIGETVEKVCDRTGFDKVPVVAVASHDTGSAVAAVPASGRDFAYISSGTWSLMGIESKKPIISERTLRYNFTNEGGAFGTFRVLKNIAGLWLLEECRRTWSKVNQHSYEDLIKMAESAEPFVSVLDPNRPEFLNPPEMPEVIVRFCRSTGQTPPQGVAQMVRIILESLALAYLETLEWLREIMDGSIERIYIVGGGSRNRLLCQLTADATGLPVSAGPVEATAIGNVLIQAAAFGRIRSLEELREVVMNSFDLEFYEPDHSSDWDEAYDRFLGMKEIGSITGGGNQR